MQTPRQCPTGKNRPRFINSASRTLPPIPGSAVAVIEDLSTENACNRDTSMSTPPSRTWLPDQLCPPERTPTRCPAALADRTAATTSATEPACTMRSGNRWGTLVFHKVARRAAS